MLAPADIEKLASMPTYDQAISMLMALMKAPVEKLARTVNEVPGKLVRTVAAVREQKRIELVVELVEWREDEEDDGDHDKSGCGD